jgi:hypothetical protein
MPYTFNGCGTKFYGSRDKGTDGSYVCTEWITFVYIPLIPLRSLRVLPVGDGVNIIIHSSQNYRTMKVPLCWPQIRNSYAFTVPILAVIIALNWSGLKGWVKHDLLNAKAGPVKVEAAPIELPMDDAQSAKACGATMKLETEAFVKLNVHKRMNDLVDASNFTNEDFTNVSKRDDIEGDAFAGYSLGFLTWNKAPEPIRQGVIQKMNESIDKGAAKLSSSDAETLREYGNKNVQMITKAFDMGRHDGRMSPCRY